MLERYALIGLFTFAAITFPILPLVLAFLFRPKKPTRLKGPRTSVASKFKTKHPKRKRSGCIFRVQIIFTRFCLSSLILRWCLLPMGGRDKPDDGFWVVEMVVFMLILCGVLAYAWRKNLLEWVSNIALDIWSFITNPFVSLYNLVQNALNGLLSTLGLPADISRVIIFFVMGGIVVTVLLIVAPVMMMYMTWLER